MPLTKLQSEVLRVLAGVRSPDSYIAGRAALNREGPRVSRDIDIFQDSQQRLESAVEADAQALTAAGLKLWWKTLKGGKREAEVEWMGERLPLEWVADSAFRFFPAQRDELFGYVLHPVDLATNRRRQPRTGANHATLSILSPSTKTFFRLGPWFALPWGASPDSRRKKCC